MPTKKEQRQIEKELELIRTARDAWLSGQLDDDELKAAFASCQYQLHIKGGTSEQFDHVAQVGCAMELLANAAIGGDEPCTVRMYAMRTWELEESLTTKIDCDPFHILPPL